MRKSIKRIISAMLSLVLLMTCMGAAASAVYEDIYVLTVVGVDSFGGGDVEAGTPMVDVLPSDPQKSGYRFIGWVVTNAAGEQIDEPAVMPAYDITYTAQWEAAGETYTITFLDDDGEIIATHEYPEGAAVEAPDYAPVGMQLSWRNTQTGKIEQLPAVMPAKDLEYLAVIEEVYYTITFMDGTAEVGEVTVGYGEQAELIDRIPQTGKVFLGWCLHPDATAPDYKVGDLLDLEADMTLYALWADEAPTITLQYPTLTFEDVITLNVYFAAEQLENVVQMGLITYRSEVTEWSVDNAEAVIPGYVYVESEGLYYAATNGIPAKELGDTLWFAVYAQLADGSYVYTRLVSYSPATYAYGQLGDPDMAPLVVAMLNYGSAAQTYFSYRTEALVNAQLTSDQLSMIESYREDMVQSIAAPDAVKTGAFVNNGGYTRRYPSITFDGAFAIDYFCIPSAVPVGDVTMYYWDQAAFDAAQVLTPENATQAITMTLDADQYEATIRGIAAKDLDKGAYVCFCYSDGTTEYCSGILPYSIGTYCVSLANTTDPMAPFAKATAVYGYYAKQLFY